jgi:hypothetical protein
MKRIKIGDLFEIQTAKGLVYGQFTHKNPEYGALIRIFSGFYSTRPNDLSAIGLQSIQFTVFFPIQSAVNAGLIVYCGNLEVTPENAIFPIFRSANFSKEAKRGQDDWWIWDGVTPKRLGRILTEEEKKFPVKGIISHPLLVERAENQYKAEIDDIY